LFNVSGSKFDSVDFDSVDFQFNSGLGFFDLSTFN